MKFMRLAIAAAILFLVSQVYINCGGSAFRPVSQADVESRAFPPEHPPIEKPQEPERAKLFLVPKQYVFNLLFEIFSSSRQTPSQVESLDRFLRLAVLHKPSVYGGACNLYDNPSGRDCGDQANVTLPPKVESTTVRSIDKISLCEQLVANDAYLQAVLEKLNLSPEPEAPNDGSLGLLYELFRRGWEADPAFVSALAGLDRALAEKGEPTFERWRMAVLMMCEDPVWEGL